MSVSVVPKIGAFAALPRFLASAVPGDLVAWPWIVAGIAAVATTFANLAALRQRSLKRLLAYSSVAPAGGKVLLLQAALDGRITVRHVTVTQAMHRFGRGRSQSASRTRSIVITRGFQSRRPRGDPSRVPPGQYVTNDFPVLSAGPTPSTPLDAWSFALRDVHESELATWSWEELLALPSSTVTVDIHCVTKWSKLDTRWKGVTIDALLEAAGVDPPAPYVTAFSDGGYTTNLAMDDLLDGRGLVVYEYDGAPIEPEHGGPARLLVPHLYFWKSAKWVRGLQFMEEDEPGFWETYGYHLRGDPWKEERYSGD